jgi:hypothetical protein
VDKILQSIVFLILRNLSLFTSNKSKDLRRGKLNTYLCSSSSFINCNLKINRDICIKLKNSSQLSSSFNSHLNDHISSKCDSKIFVYNLLCVYGEIEMKIMSAVSVSLSKLIRKRELVHLWEAVVWRLRFTTICQIKK